MDRADCRNRDSLFSCRNMKHALSQQEQDLSTTAGTWNRHLISQQQEHDLSTTKGTWNRHLNSLKQKHDLSTTKGTWNMRLNSLKQKHAQISWNIQCFGLQQDHAFNPLIQYYGTLMHCSAAGTWKMHLFSFQRRHDLNPQNTETWINDLFSLQKELASKSQLQEHGTCISLSLFSRNKLSTVSSNAVTLNSSSLFSCRNKNFSSLLSIRNMEQHAIMKSTGTEKELCAQSPNTEKKTFAY